MYPLLNCVCSPLCMCNKHRNISPFLSQMDNGGSTLGISRGCIIRIEKGVVLVLSIHFVSNLMLGSTHPQLGVFALVYHVDAPSKLWLDYNCVSICWIVSESCWNKALWSVKGGACVGVDDPLWPWWQAPHQWQLDKQSEVTSAHLFIFKFVICLRYYLILISRRCNRFEICDLFS